MDQTVKRPSNSAQLASPSFILPVLDQNFLLSDDLRGVRFQLEYEKAESILRAWRINSTIVAFGSARIREDGPGRHGRWYADACAFGKIASLEGGAKYIRNGGRENVIATGGGPGLMEAANRGAYEAGAPTIGFNITLPHEQEPNPYTTPALTFLFHYFAIRKMHLAMRANALIAFPGGFGTLDELFEVVTLRQTGKSGPIPIILYDEDYWRSLIDFQMLVREGMIDAEDENLFTFVNDPRAAWEAARARCSASEHTIRSLAEEIAPLIE